MAVCPRSRAVNNATGQRNSAMTTRPPAWSNTDTKAVKLVMDRRVTVKWSNVDAAHGIVDGFNSTYEVSYSPAGGACTCPAGVSHRKCSHIKALELEVLRLAEGVKI